MHTTLISTKNIKPKKTTKPKIENKEKEIKNTLTNENKEIKKENKKENKNEWKIENIVYDRYGSGSDLEPRNLVKVHYRYEYIFGVNEYLAFDDEPLGQVTLVSVRPGEGFSGDLGDDMIVGPSFLITDSNHPTRILIPRTGIKVITGPHLFGSDIFGNLGGQTLNGSKIFLDNRDGIIKKQFVDQEADVYFMIISRKVIG